MIVDTFKGLRILIIGDVMLDHFVSGEVERVSPEAPALVLRANADRWMLGGAANVAANIASLGGVAAVVGVIGRDRAADRIAALIAESNGSILDALIRDDAVLTVQKSRYLAGDRHLLRVDREPADLPKGIGAKLMEAARRHLKDCDAVIVSDYAKGTISAPIMRWVVDAARRLGVAVLVDPKRRDLRLYEGATVLTPNRNELALATGEPCDTPESCARAAQAAAQETGASVLLTLAEQGMALYESGSETWRAPAQAKVVRDVSGAGDTVIAACALGIAGGASLAEAAHLANTAASIAVSKSGLASVAPQELSEALGVAAGGGADAAPGKLRALASAIAAREAWRAEGLKVGFTNGCFDLLHPGHVRLLTQAKEFCDRLIVALNTDASVARLKGADRPVQTESDRAEVIGALRSADLVVLFDQDTPLELVKALRPDVLIKGADYAGRAVVGADEVVETGGDVVLVDLAEGHSTTGVISRIKS